MTCSKASLDRARVRTDNRPQLVSSWGDRLGPPPSQLLLVLVNRTDFGLRCK